jgi:hypothetical protein
MRWRHAVAARLQAARAESQAESPHAAGVAAAQAESLLAAVLAAAQVSRARPQRAAVPTLREPARAAVAPHDAQVLQMRAALPPQEPVVLPREVQLVRLQLRQAPRMPGASPAQLRRRAGARPALPAHRAGPSPVDRALHAHDHARRAAQPRRKLQVRSRTQDARREAVLEPTQ